MKRILLLLIIFVFYSCLKDKKEQLSLTFNRFENALFVINNENTEVQIQNLQNNFGTFNEVFETQIMQKGAMTDSAYANELLSFINHSDMREAYDSVSIMYLDLSDIKKELNLAFTLFNHDFPTYPIPKITTFFGGFNYGVVTYDNNIAIGLENFLGKNSKFYRLLGNPEYLRFQKQRKFISSNVMEVWLNEYFEQYLIGRDLLSQMIYKGKLMYCIDKMLPNVLLSSKFRFTEEQLHWVINNESNIWTYFIENDLLYSSHEQDFRTFLHYAPFAKGMPNDSPARVAYFIGYQIVSEFIERTDRMEVSIEDMIKFSDSRQFLKLSKYKPSK
ncbi:hypothetical protein OAJ65_03060 [Flavobacteriales bacterium]|nr:hypothetical protein [Flavobacteriales bacterium]